MVHFKKIDIFSSSPEEWRLYHKFRHLFHSENEPEEPFLDDKTIEEFIKVDIINSGMEVSVFRMYDNDAVIGSFYYGFFLESSKSYCGNEKIVRFEIQLLKKYHHHGIATKALQLMVKDCEKKEKSVFVSEFQNIHYKPFFEAIGGTIAQTNAESKLTFSTIDISMIKNWITEAEKANPETRVEIIKDRIPEYLEDEFAKTFNETIQLIPRDNMESKALTFDVDSLRNMEKTDESVGALSIKAVAIEKDGRISALTRVKILPGRENFLSQGLTGVPLKYRGRKLGKWVKAKLILYIMNNYPDVEAILTGNAESNAPMLHINTKLGFKKYKESITGQIHLERLNSYLESRNVPLIEVIM